MVTSQSTVCSVRKDPQAHRHRAPWRDTLMIQVGRMTSGSDIPGPPGRSGDASSLLIDSAISHAEKLRRVLELEAWLNGTTSDKPLPAATSRKWQEERAQLLAELRLEELSAAYSGPATADAVERGRSPGQWLRKLIRRLRHGDASQ